MDKTNPLRAVDLEQVPVLPVERFKMARWLMEEHQGEITRLAGVRARAAADVRDKFGATKAANLLDISRAQLYAVLSHGHLAPAAHNPYAHRREDGLWEGWCDECGPGPFATGRPLASETSVGPLLAEHRRLRNAPPGDRDAARVNQALRSKGLAEDQLTTWWNTSNETLAGFTPVYVWLTMQDYDGVWEAVAALPDPGRPLPLAEAERAVLGGTKGRQFKNRFEG